MNSHCHVGSNCCESHSCQSFQVLEPLCAAVALLLRDSIRKVLCYFSPPFLAPRVAQAGQGNVKFLRRQGVRPSECVEIETLLLTNKVSGAAGNNYLESESRALDCILTGLPLARRLCAACRGRPPLTTRVTTPTSLRICSISSIIMTSRKLNLVPNSDLFS